MHFLQLGALMLRYIGFAATCTFERNVFDHPAGHISLRTTPFPTKIAPQHLNNGVIIFTSQWWQEFVARGQRPQSSPKSPILQLCPAIQMVCLSLGTLFSDRYLLSKQLL